jgi:Tfp pilus assembly PilM family ATPase
MRFSGWQQILKGSARGLIHPPPIAVDFGTASLKILQIGAGDPPSLVAAACLDTPAEMLADPGRRLTFQLGVLPGLIKSCEFKGRRTVCALPAAQTYCKHMQFQMEPGVPVASLIRPVLSAQLKCDPEALLLRHVEVGPVARSNKIEVICMAASREMVERLMQTLRSVKLDPVGMHSEFNAALHAFGPVGKSAEEGAAVSLYLDMGAGTTKVFITHGRNLVFARTIELGGRHLDAAVARQLKLDLEQARGRRLAMTRLAGAAARPQAAPSKLTGRLGFLAGEGAQPAAVQSGTLTAESPGSAPEVADLTEPLEILTDEISMCLRYYGSIFPDRRINGAIFVGGEARHVGLCQHVARVLKLPAQVADPMARITRTGHEPVIGVDFEHSQPGWAVALGLCLSPTDL